MKLVQIMGLIGKPVDGLKADMRSRNSDGSLKHDFTEKEGPRIVTMRSVEIKRERGRDWMFWRWDTSGSPIPHDCGYSGIRMDSPGIETYYLEMQDS